MIGVAVVVEVRLYREAVARALGEHGDLRLSLAAGSASHALAEIARLRPDVLLLDLATAGALETLPAVRATSPGTRVVALGFRGTDEHAVAAAEAGVNGYVGVEQRLDDVLSAIRGVMRGEAPCDGRIAAALMRRVAMRPPEERCPAALAQLTSRERRILELLAAGMSNKEIAGELVIGVATVKSHVHAILRKLDVSRRGAAADVFHRSQPARAALRVA